jgi:hypothetical protein
MVMGAVSKMVADYVWQAVQIGEVYEYPVSAFEDWPGHFLRPAQLTAASYGELANALSAAERSGWESFVIVSHSFELLGRMRTRSSNDAKVSVLMPVSELASRLVLNQGLCRI